MFEDITVATTCTSLKKPSGNKRTDRPVDQSRRQRFFFRRPAFALEEAAGDLAGSVSALLIVDGQREEVLTRLHVLLANNGNQYDGVVQIDHDSAMRLASDFAGFQGQRVTTELDDFLTGVIGFTSIVGWD